VKRSLLSLLRVALAALFVAGCGGGGGDKASPEEARAHAESGGTMILWTMSGQPAPSGYRFTTHEEAAWDTCVNWGSSSNPCTNVVLQTAGCNPGTYACSYRFYFQSGYQTTIGNSGANVGYIRGFPADPSGQGEQCTSREFGGKKHILCYSKNDSPPFIQWSHYFDNNDGLPPLYVGYTTCNQQGDPPTWWCQSYYTGGASWSGGWNPAYQWMPNIGLKSPGSEDFSSDDFWKWIPNDYT